MWHTSKQQNTVEASTFGNPRSLAMRNAAVELVESLQYKLCMFGCPIEGPTNILCDNEAFYKEHLPTGLHTQEKASFRSVSPLP